MSSLRPGSIPTVPTALFSTVPGVELNEYGAPGAADRRGRRSPRHALILADAGDGTERSDQQRCLGRHEETKVSGVTRITTSSAIRSPFSTSDRIRRDFSETTHAVAPLRALVEIEYRELDLVEAQVIERVPQHEAGHGPSEPVAELGPIEETNGVPASSSGLEEVQPRHAEKPAVVLDDPFDLAVLPERGDPGLGPFGGQHRVDGHSGSEHAQDLGVEPQRPPTAYVVAGGRPENHTVASEYRTERHVASMSNPVGTLRADCDARRATRPTVPSLARCAGGGAADLGLAQEPADRFVVRVSPPEAERVARRVGIDPVPNGCSWIVGILQQARTQRHGGGVGGDRVSDVQVEMDLLRDSIGPIRRNMVGRKLYADHPSTVCVDNAVPPLVPEDAAAQHPCPERALRFQVSGVEDDHPAHEFHAATSPFSFGRTQAVATNKAARGPAQIALTVEFVSRLPSVEQCSQMGTQTGSHGTLRVGVP